MSVGKIQRYGLPFSNVVPTGPATNQVTPGRTLEVLRLRLGGTTLTKAMIPSLKLKANGKVIIEGSGAQLDAINAYRGEATNAAFLDVQFADYVMLSELDRMVGAFDTSLGIGNITTEVNIAGATAPTLTPILVESAQQKDKTGVAAPFAPLISKILSYPFSVATGGKLPVNLPFGAQSGSVIKRMHFFHTGTMTGIEVKEDGLVVHESVTAENTFDQQKAGRVPQANCYTVDFVLDGNIKKALDTRTARSLEVLPTFSAAGSGTVLVEYLDPLGNL
ncbi:major capsid protein P2 [uncultured Hydrogenophaga sp.]|uniref:major capsid protein P2 n=1 Tax=uncultured Hydrogenophaga sp. TaxID=199683 RepID=UPI00265FB810|nr:major capsid protein P2 [uncultured Hydrogenophaga sp.]